MESAKKEILLLTQVLKEAVMMAKDENQVAAIAQYYIQKINAIANPGK